MECFFLELSPGDEPNERTPTYNINDALLWQNVWETFIGHGIRRSIRIGRHLSGIVDGVIVEGVIVDWVIAGGVIVDGVIIDSIAGT